MLGPIVEMLCQAIGGGYMRVLPGSAKLRPITLKYSCSRVADSLLIIRKQRVIAQWRFKRLIVHRERSFGQSLTGKKPGHAFGVHDKGPHTIHRRLIDFKVGRSEERRVGGVGT